MKEGAEAAVARSQQRSLSHDREVCPQYQDSAPGGITLRKQLWQGCGQWHRDRTTQLYKYSWCHTRAALNLPQPRRATPPWGIALEAPACPSTNIHEVKPAARAIVVRMLRYFLPQPVCALVTNQEHSLGAPGMDCTLL